MDLTFNIYVSKRRALAQINPTFSYFGGICMRSHLFLLLKCSKNKACDTWNSTSGKKTWRKMLKHTAYFFVLRIGVNTIKHNERSKKGNDPSLDYDNHICAPLVNFINFFLHMPELELILSFDICLIRRMRFCRDTKNYHSREITSLKVSHGQHFQS